jgi:hypothetical protein
VLDVIHHTGILLLNRIIVDKVLNSLKRRPLWAKLNINQ